MSACTYSNLGRLLQGTMLCSRVTYAWIPLFDPYLLLLRSCVTVGSFLNFCFSVFKMKIGVIGSWLSIFNSRRTPSRKSKHLCIDRYSVCMEEKELSLTKPGYLTHFQNRSQRREILSLYLVSHWILLATADQALLDQPEECPPPPGARSWENIETQITVRPWLLFQLPSHPQTLSPLRREGCS